MNREDGEKKLDKKRITVREKAFTKHWENRGVPDEQRSLPLGRQDRGARDPTQMNRHGRQSPEELWCTAAASDNWKSTV